MICTNKYINQERPTWIYAYCVLYTLGDVNKNKPSAPIDVKGKRLISDIQSGVTVKNKTN